MSKSIRIGGACGYWGDSLMSTPQLLEAHVDYIVYDYLAEITMSILARARAKDATMGYAADFVTAVLKPNLSEIHAKKVKILSNAGGVNPEACGVAVRALVQELGLDLKVAVVSGDDLSAKVQDLGVSNVAEMFTGEPFPDPKKLASVNAYIGAFPIAKALDDGADIVITGRCVDSAVTLGACIHEFGWTEDQYDLLAAGSLAGHLIECGPQATGGNFTDWQLVADSLQDIGYPIAIMNPDGSFDVTKPENTGGLVNTGTVAEQMLYEIGDPQSYILPDVVCDFSEVAFEERGRNLVHVTGATGRAPTDTFKVCATYMDGYRGTMVMNFYGMDATEKAKLFAETTFARAEALLRKSNAGEYTEKSVEILGAESQYGSYSAAEDVREVALKLACKHPSDKAVSLLFREASGMGLATPPGLSGFGAGRPKPTPVVRLFSFLIDKSEVDVSVDVEGERTSHSAYKADSQGKLIRPSVPGGLEAAETMVGVPLVKLAWGRSGDKGDKANIGVIARKAEFLPYIWDALSEQEVAKRFDHFLKAGVDRFYLPGSNAINFLLHDVLAGGGVASLRADPQGKGYAQILLSTEVPIPEKMAESL